MKQKTRYWLTLIAIGYCGGTIWTLPYIRYVFYDQMIQTMNITNTQVGLLGTVFSAVAIVRNIPGAYLSDNDALYIPVLIFHYFLYLCVGDLGINGYRDDRILGIACKVHQ